MTIVHILRDGTKLNDVAGYVINDLPEFYSIMKNIERRIGYENDRR